MNINGKAYKILGTIHLSPTIRKANGAVIWISLLGERGASYTLACYEGGANALYRGEFAALIARNVEAY